MLSVLSFYATFRHPILEASALTADMCKYNICFSNLLAYFKFVRKYPCCATGYANGYDFCANTLAYAIAKSGNGFVQHAYFLTISKYANKLPKPYIPCLYSHMPCVLNC